MSAEDAERAKRIRALNDAFRQSGRGGKVLITAGLAALAEEHVREVLKAVAGFSDFGEANDPYEEHDCATLTIGEIEILWKIDYYDRELAFHSPDPADPLVTARVMTVMLAHEY